MLIARIRYQMYHELGVNRITSFVLMSDSGEVSPPGKNEIIVPADDLPRNFISHYKECEVKDGKVLWSPELYTHFRTASTSDK